MHHALDQPSEPVIERLLVGASGAINVIGLHSYLVALRGVATRTTVVLTRSAEALVSARAMRAVSGMLIHTDDESHDLAVPHMELALWADLVVVLPATGNILGKAANGIADDLLSSILLARSAPVIFVPSMSPVMWANPAVRRNVEQLRQDGHRFVLGDEARPTLKAATGEWVMSDLMPGPAEAAERIAIEAKAVRSANGGGT